MGDLPQQDQGHPFTLGIVGHDAQPIFRSQFRRFHAHHFHGFLRIHDLSLVGYVFFADESQPHMGQGGDIPFSDGRPHGDPGIDPVIQEIQVMIQQFKRQPRMACKDFLEPQEQDGPHLIIRMVGRNAQTMAVQQIPVVLGKEIFIKFLILVPAHAPVQPIDRFPFRRHVKQDLSGLPYPFCRLGCDFNLTIAINDTVSIFQR